MNPLRLIFFGSRLECSKVNCAEKLEDLYPPQGWKVMGVNCVSKNSRENLAAWEQVVNLEVSLDIVSLAT